MIKLTLAKLKSRLVYEPETGLFKYKHDHNRMKAGDIAGRPNTNGHIQISIDGVRYMAHTLAWFYMTGFYPDFIVDHKDRVYDNNRWTNLRKATHSENAANSRTPCNNTSGMRGVHFDLRKNKWIAQISFQGKKKHLGTFNFPEDAQNAYNKAALAYFGEYACVSD